ncbi:hypothetical protein ACFCVO_06905 [Agromyces sp. NPDC056379]|uniref:hypothetical protein n=1 Tax=unclassified Agromyces TaxID=2639701 RepID=UPI0035D69089
MNEARQALAQYFVEHPPAISGDLFIADEWFEDEQDYLPVWGSRQFHLDGVEAFARWDNLAIFIDKRTGEVRQEFRTPNIVKISSMTPVVVTE